MANPGVELRYYNDTWAYNTSTVYTSEGTALSDSASCDYEARPAECLTLRGGWYDPAGSSTARNFSDVDAAGGDAGDTLRQLDSSLWYSSWVQDALAVGEGITLQSYPIGSPGVDIGAQEPQNLIGLGRNSTLLRALKEAGHIASLSYSFWWGQTGATPNVEMDGQVVFGGYDAAKTTGPNFTFPIQPWAGNCPSGIYLNLSSITLDFVNGSTAELAPGTQLTGCAELDWNTFMQMPTGPFGSFEASTDTYHVNISQGPNWGAAVYSSGEVYDGSLSVAIADGPSITVPNNLLVVPQAFIDENSGAISTNTSAYEVLLSPSDSQPPITLGRQFFSLLYLLVDYDAGTYTVWTANSTTETDVVAIGSNCTSTGEGGNGGHDGGTKPAGESSGSPTSKTSISGGAIAGIVIGCVATFAIVAALAWFCRRRGKRRTSVDSGGDDRVLKGRTSADVQELSAVERPCEVDGSGVSQRPDVGTRKETGPAELGA